MTPVCHFRNTLSYVAVFAAIAMPAQARVKEMPRWYGGISGGMVVLQEYTLGLNNFPGAYTPRDVSFDWGLGVGAQAGYRISPYLALELEVRHSSNKLDKVTPALNNKEKGSKQTATALMANMVASYRNQTLFTPYIGAGAGYMYVRSPVYGELQVGPDTERRDYKDWVLAYQFMTGVAYELPYNPLGGTAEVTFGYRFLTSEEPETKFTTGSPGLTATFDHTAQSADIGLRMYF